MCDHKSDHNSVISVAMIFTNTVSFKITHIISFRVLGSLLSAHIIITDTRQPFGDMTIKGYDDELLHMAHDLAVRLLPAFENTKTGIPYPRVCVEKLPIFRQRKFSLLTQGVTC